jgi:hypothetical protein
MLVVLAGCGDLQVDDTADPPQTASAATQGLDSADPLNLDTDECTEHADCFGPLFLYPEYQPNLGCSADSHDCGATWGAAWTDRESDRPYDDLNVGSVPNVSGPSLANCPNVNDRFYAVRLHDAVVDCDNSDAYSSLIENTNSDSSRELRWVGLDCDYGWGVIVFTSLPTTDDCYNLAMRGLLPGQ